MTGIQYILFSKFDKEVIINVSEMLKIVPNSGIQKNKDNIR